MKKSMMVCLCLLLSINLFFLSLEVQVSLLIVHAAEPIIRTQVVGYGFQNQYEEMTTTYTFGFDGSLNVENTFGYQFVFPQPKFQPALPVVVDITENSSHVVQHFFVNGTDKQGLVQTLDLRVFFDFSVFVDGAKISLIGTSTDPDSEIEYEFENPRSAAVSNTTTRFRIGNIYFDWEDLQGATAFEFAANKLKVKFAASFSLDPSIVSTASSFSATADVFQRKVAYAQGRWWVFYSGSNKVAVRSSVDGASWSSASTFSSADFGTAFAIWQHGNYFDIVSDNAVNVQYRRGLFNADGTITWSTAFQNVALTTGRTPNVVSIAVDSAGTPWIFYAASNLPKVTKSDFNNGTWSTSTGYPLTLNSTASYYWGGVIVALASQKIYVAYDCSSNFVKDPLFGKLYNGTAWQSEEQISSGDAWSFFTFSGVAVEDTLYFAYPTSTEVVFRVRDSVTGWGSETAFDFLTNDFCLSTASSVIYLFHETSSGLAWRSFADNVWSTDAGISESSFTGLTTLKSATTSYELGYVYTLSSAPYYVKFGKITTQEPSIPEVFLPAGHPPVTPSELPSNRTTAVKPSPLPNLGLWGLIGAVGLIAVGGVLAATSSSSSSHGYRKSSAAKPRYSPPSRPRKTTYRKVKG